MSEKLGKLAPHIRKQYTLKCTNCKTALNGEDPRITTLKPGVKTCPKCGSKVIPINPDNELNLSIG